MQVGRRELNDYWNGIHEAKAKDRPCGPPVMTAGDPDRKRKKPVQKSVPDPVAALVNETSGNCR